jgi:ABC-type phosphate/phosphonate transport system substrate-binding protein
MIASFPMYDRPETRGAYDRLWHRIRDELRLLWRDLPDAAVPLPEDLAHPANPWDHWLSSDLILSQTCGLPYRTRLHSTARLVGTPDYALPGCRPGYYNSVIVMHRDDPRRDPRDWPELTLAVNAFESQSGWAAPQTFMTNQGFAFSEVRITGSHRNSALAVAERRADIAAIDAQSWRMIRRWDDFSDELTEVCRTEPTPGLPLISALPDGRNDLYFAVSHHLATLPDDDRKILDLKGLVDIHKDRYLAIPTPPPL